LLLLEAGACGCGDAMVGAGIVWDVKRAVIMCDDRPYIEETTAYVTKSGLFDRYEKPMHICTEYLLREKMTAPNGCAKKIRNEKIKTTCSQKHAR
jgi:hypothetical protein